MITIIYAPPGFGKSVLMSHFLNQFAFDEDRLFAMRSEITIKNMNGFKIPMPDNCVSANYPLTMQMEGCSYRFSRKINPFRLGFANPKVETHFNFPFEVIGIDEAQIYLNSRMAFCYPAWQSRWYEAHRHNNLDIFLATQRPGLIDPNIRELADFLEVVDLRVKNNIFDEPCRLVWHCRYIPYARMYDKYISSGGLDRSCYQEREIVAEYNVFNLYNSQSCKPKFYDGYLRYLENDGICFDDSKIDYAYSSLPSESASAYIDYLKSFRDEYPDGFYSKVFSDSK